MAKQVIVSLDLEDLDPLSSDVHIPAPAMKKLQELASRAVERTRRRAEIMRALEDLAAGKFASDKLIDTSQDDTQFMKVVRSAETASTTNVPTCYSNHTVSPYSLILLAVLEHKRHYPELPREICVSERTFEKLPHDMKCCTGEEFDGKSILFPHNGEMAYIPVFPAKEKNVIIPKNTVWCFK